MPALLTICVSDGMEFPFLILFRMAGTDLYTGKEINKHVLG
jgi:hypothetical protein